MAKTKTAAKSTKPAWAEALPYEVAAIPGGWLILSTPPVKVEDPLASHCPSKLVPQKGLPEWLTTELGYGAEGYDDFQKRTGLVNPFNAPQKEYPHGFHIRGTYFDNSEKHWVYGNYFVSVAQVEDRAFRSQYHRWTLRNGKTIIAQGSESTVAIALARELGYGIVAL
jgi:hypothetical protein